MTRPRQPQLSDSTRVTQTGSTDVQLTARKGLSRSPRRALHASGAITRSDAAPGTPPSRQSPPPATGPAVPWRCAAAAAGDAAGTAPSRPRESDHPTNIGRVLWLRGEPFPACHETSDEGHETLRPKQPSQHPIRSTKHLLT